MKMEGTESGAKQCRALVLQAVETQMILLTDNLLVLGLLALDLSGPPFLSK
jgi:hypothetical protein